MTTQYVLPARVRIPRTFEFDGFLGPSGQVVTDEQDARKFAPKADAIVWAEGHAAEIDAEVGEPVKESS